jgi:hypothetical protein
MKSTQPRSGARRMARSATRSRTAADTSVAASAAAVAPPRTTAAARKPASDSNAGERRSASPNSPAPARMTPRTAPVSRSSRDGVLAVMRESSSGPASSSTVIASNASAPTPTIRRSRARLPSSSPAGMTASTSGVPSGAAIANAVPPAGTVRPGSWIRSSTRPRLVGIAYSPLVRSCAAGRRGVSTCSTATEPSRLRSGVVATIGSRYTSRSHNGEATRNSGRAAGRSGGRSAARPAQPRGPPRAS